MNLEEARASGSKRYFTGKPCKRGHVAERSTLSKKCSQCHLEDGRARYARNIDRERKRSSEYHAANKQRRVKVRAANYLANRDAVRKRHAVWMAENKDRWKEYMASIPERLREYAAQYRAQKLRATPPWLTVDDRAEIAALYAEASRLERETGIPHHVDHIIPLRGDYVCGLHVPSNLQILTKDENLRKSNRWEDTQAD